MCMPQICKTRARWQGLDCSKSSHHEVQLLDPSEAHLMTDAGQCGARVLGVPHSHKLRGATNEVVKVTNGLPTVRSDVQPRRTTRLPTGREPYGDGASVVVVGVTTDQGGRESRLQGEGRQVFSTAMTGRYARCETPKLCSPSSRDTWKENTGEPDDAQVSCPVRRQAGGKG